MKEQDAAHSFEKTHPDFPEWIETEAGKGCLQWPISEVKYLRNRLFWAFDAGRNCVWDQYTEQKAELTRLRSELQQERELRKELVGYVVAYHGLSSLTSDEDIYIRSLIKKAKLNI